MKAILLLNDKRQLLVSLPYSVNSVPEYIKLLLHDGDKERCFHMDAEVFHDNQRVPIYSEL